MKATKDSANLDVLRSIAVLCVFVSHLVHFASGRVTEFDWHLGQLGVLMFFVHTSLVLMFSLERSSTKDTNLTASFYARRAFRIYPLSMVSVLFMYVTRCPPGHEFVYPTWTHWELLANLTLTQNLFYVRDMINVLWSLPIEVQMYFFLPFLFVGFRSRSAMSVLLLWLASIPIALTQAHFINRLSVLSYAPCFLAGILSWRLHNSQRARLPGWLWPACMALTSLIWFSGGREQHWYYRWAFCLTLGFTIPFFAEVSSTLLKTAAKTLATYSYGVYLSHVPIMILAFVIVKNPFVRWPLFLTLAVAVPYGLYHLIERPGIRAGQTIAGEIASGEFRTRLLRVGNFLATDPETSRTEYGPRCHELDSARGAPSSCECVMDKVVTGAAERAFEDLCPRHSLAPDE